MAASCRTVSSSSWAAAAVQHTGWYQQHSRASTNYSTARMQPGATRRCCLLSTWRGRRCACMRLFVRMRLAPAGDACDTSYTLKHVVISHVCWSGAEIDRASSGSSVVAPLSKSIAPTRAAEVRAWGCFNSSVPCIAASAAGWLGGVKACGSLLASSLVTICSTTAGWRGAFCAPQWGGCQRHHVALHIQLVESHSGEPAKLSGKAARVMAVW